MYASFPLTLGLTLAVELQNKTVHVELRTGARLVRRHLAVAYDVFAVHLYPGEIAECGEMRHGERQHFARRRRFVVVADEANVDGSMIHATLFGCRRTRRKRPAREHLVAIADPLDPEVVSDGLPTLRLGVIAAYRLPGHGARILRQRMVDD